MDKRARILLLFILYLYPKSNYAQFWEFGGMAGIAVYHGDIAPDFSMQAPGAAANIFARHNIDSRLALRIGFAVGSIAADDAKSINAYQQARNLNFNSTIFEGSLCMEFNFLPFHHKSRKNKAQFSPYLLAGVGVFYHSPQTKYEGITYKLQALGTEGQAVGEEYSLVQPAFILGGGFKFDISPQWGIIIEGATRLLFFDYLDDVSGHYANKEMIRSQRGSLGSVAAALSDRSNETGTTLGGPNRQRGDIKTNDAYTFLTVGLIYTLYEQKCPAY